MPPPVNPCPESGPGYRRKRSQPERGVMVANRAEERRESFRCMRPLQWLDLTLSGAVRRVGEGAG